MRHPHLSSCLTILFCFSQIAAAPSPSPSVAPLMPQPAASPIDLLAAEDLQQALGLIKKNYVAPELLSETELQRATLAGLLSRLSPSLQLLPAGKQSTPAPPALYQEIIEEHIGYVRPGALNRGELQMLDASLRNFAAKKIDALILDLRACLETDDYAVAADFAKRFVPNGKPIFALRGTENKEERAFSSNQEPAYTGFVVLLIDGETAGAAEALAGALRFYNKAIAVGETTAGRALDFSDLALPSGKILRVAVAEAVLPDQRVCFPEGLKPDLPVAMSHETKHQIFQQSLTSGLAPFIFEADRPHLNEAALLAGTNPEIEAAQAAQQRRSRSGEKEKPGLHDAPLQRAVDLITSINIYQKPPGRAP